MLPEGIVQKAILINSQELFSRTCFHMEKVQEHLIFFTLSKCGTNLSLPIRSQQGFVVHLQDKVMSKFHCKNTIIFLLVLSLRSSLSPVLHFQMGKSDLLPSTPLPYPSEPAKWIPNSIASSYFIRISCWCFAGINHTSFLANNGYCNNFVY